MAQKNLKTLNGNTLNDKFAELIHLIHQKTQDHPDKKAKIYYPEDFLIGVPAKELENTPKEYYADLLTKSKQWIGTKPD